MLAHCASLWRDGTRSLTPRNSRCVNSVQRRVSNPTNKRTLSKPTTLPNRYQVGGVRMHYERPRATRQVDRSPKRPVLITTPIFYVNASPHIGHLFSALLADALARWHRILGHPTLLTTGTDEHGIKIQQAAEKSGKEPLEFCDEVNESFLSLWQVANISINDYVRTTEERHRVAVETIWNELEQSGHIYLGEFEGWYSVSDEAFYTPLQVQDELDAVTSNPTGRKVAIESGSEVTWIKEENYKFRLSKFGPLLKEWIEDREPIYPPARANEILQDLTQRELKDLSVSRLKEKLHWGIPVPSDPKHVIYVWLDALTNYLTVCGFPHWGPTSSGDLRDFWPASYHIIGKDILKFHSVYWPAFLLAAGLPLPERIITHAHWTKGKKKISKSTGNIVDPFEIITRLGVDPVRYVLLRQGGMTNDGDYNEEEMENIISDELSNGLGNLISRSVSTGINPYSSWPVGRENFFSPPEKELADKLYYLPDQVDELYKQCEFGKAIMLISSVIADANHFFTTQEPWRFLPKVSKGPVGANVTSHAEERPLIEPPYRYFYENKLYLCYEAIRLCALLLQPVIPALSSQILDYLGIPDNKRNPLEFGYGIDWRKHSNLLSIPPKRLILLDDRAKKAEKRAHKVERKYRSASL